MYIEFRLPNGAAGQAALHAKMLIDQGLTEWYEQYSIPFKTKEVKYTYRVIFDDPANYSFWALTWVSTNYATGRWSLKEPMNPPK